MTTNPNLQPKVEASQKVKGVGSLQKTPRVAWQAGPTAPGTESYRAAPMSHRGGAKRPVVMQFEANEREPNSEQRGMGGR